MTNNFFLQNYDYELGKISSDYIDYLNSLSNEELRKELYFIKYFLKDYVNLLLHCCSIYQLYISEKIINMIKTNHYPSESDLLDISKTCKEMVDYLGSATLPIDKKAYENYPDYWIYFSGYKKDQMMHLIIEGVHDCASLREDYNYTIYKLNLIIGMNYYVLGREITDEHTLKTIDNAMADDDLKSIGIVKTDGGYDFLERVKHIELTLNWLFYQYLEL